MSFNILALLPLTHYLTMSCIGQIQAGEIWALRVPLFHVCPKSACCSCIYRGWPVQSAVRFLLFSGFPFFYGLSHLGAGPCLMVGFAFLQPTLFSYYHLLPYHSIIPTAKLFASILLVLFGPTVYSSPNGPVQLLVLLLHHWQAPVSHLFSLGRPRPICFPWAFLALFLAFAFSWAFTEYFGFPRPNCIIPHP